MRGINASSLEHTCNMDSQETRVTNQKNTQDTRVTSLQETLMDKAENTTSAKTQTRKLRTANINEETVRWKVCSNDGIKDSKSLEIYKTNRRQRYYELPVAGNACSRYYASVT